MHLNILKTCIFTIGIINVTLNGIITYFVWNQDGTSECPVQSNIALASGAMMTTALSVSWYMIIRETRPSVVHPELENVVDVMSSRIGENLNRNLSEFGMTIQNSMMDIISDMDVGTSMMNDANSFLSDGTANTRIGSSMGYTYGDTDDDKIDKYNKIENPYEKTVYSNCKPPRRKSISSQQSIERRAMRINSQSEYQKFRSDGRAILMRRHSLPLSLKEESYSDAEVKVKKPNSHDGVVNAPLVNASLIGPGIIKPLKPDIAEDPTICND